MRRLRKFLPKRFWFWMFWYGLRNYTYGTGGSCANRWTNTFQVGHIEFTVIQRDTSEPDGYSREEVLRMLQTVREAEKRMQWKCPEPQS